MPKKLVETTGDFLLVDYQQGSLVINNDRPTVVEDTTFVSARAAANQIKVLANLDDEATDEEFAKYWRESDKDPRLAIDAYLSSFGDQVSKETEEPAPTRRGRQPKPEVKDEEE